jgi:hypothetical protein
VDEEVMRFWIRHMWLPHVSSSGNLNYIVADIYRAQKTDEIVRLLAEEYTTIIALIPPGGMSLI